MKAVVFGAGNIGRGFIGQLLYRSGFQVVFVDAVPDLVVQLNTRQSYTVYTVDGDSAQGEAVTGVRAVLASDGGAVAEAVAGADILATAVGVGNLPRIAPALAGGLQRRLEGGGPPTNILVCENMIGANRHLKALVEAELPAVLRPRLDEAVGFVETSIGRMVPLQRDGPEEPLAVRTEAYAKLPYDATCWRGEPVALRGDESSTDFHYYILRKLYIHNLGHAALAYLGKRKVLLYIHEAVADEGLAAFAAAAMGEAAAALDADYPEKREETQAHIGDLLRRFANRGLKDQVARVAADPMRKLGPEDRLVGAVKYCAGHGVHCPYILCVIAAALGYREPGDAGAAELARRLETEGVRGFLAEHCRIEDPRTAETIEAIYRMAEETSLRGASAPS